VARINQKQKGVAEMSDRPNIILVHGAWADGSCWGSVIERLQAEGFQVRAPQFPMSSLADDVARLRQVLEFQDGPTVVVGHSYGGQIITALGSDAPNVVGLVYIAAFALDEGESLGALLSQGPVTPALAHLFTDERGFGWLSEDDFVNQHRRDLVRDRLDGAHHHGRRAGHRRRLLGLRGRRPRDVPADGVRDRNRAADRRYDRPLCARARSDAAARRVELVPAELAAVASSLRRRGTCRAGRRRRGRARPGRSEIGAGTMSKR